MANPPVLSPKPASAAKTLGKARIALLPALLVLLAVCSVFAWMTRDAMAHLSFLNSKAGTNGPSSIQSIVDLRPWQTAQTLSALAVTTEEHEFARRAERLADHEVDQAFASALRQAGLDAEHGTMSGEALALKQKVAQLEQLQKQDQALVDKLSAKPGATDDLQVAKAQLGLDSDELADAQHDLARASGDESPRIQEELAAHEESMKKYDTQVETGQIAVISVSGHRTLAGRIKAWLDQRQRYGLLQQAQQQAFDDARDLTAQHNALEAKASAAAAASAPADQDAQLANLRDRSVEREILSIDDDRIQTQQQLASVYAKWAAQVDLQHRIVLHLILDSLMVILLIMIAMLVCDAAIRHVMERPAIDRRQMRTLRNILELGVQAVGVACILLVIFGPPQQTPTILGLATAALTIALQDYIVAFLGWFTLVGKNGIHVGDWVEINSVGGEVVEFKLMTTTLLETDQGLPTGRRITFMNSYAIRGQYFNFSTAGQWTWDEIVVNVPANADMHELAQRVERVVVDETHENVERAHGEWRQGNRDVGLSRFDASPVVNLRTSGSGIEIHIRYVTPADERFEFRNRLYQRVIELLHEPEPAAQVQR
jgi:small-conductance mechanosensitive channel